LGSPKPPIGTLVKHLLIILISILLLSSPLFGQKETKVVEKMRMFVSVGDPGTILTSPDGNSWTKRTSGISKYLYGVTYGNRLFVTVGESGTILTSSDGIFSWTKRTSGTSKYLRGVTYSQ